MTDRRHRTWPFLGFLLAMAPSPHLLADEPARDAPTDKTDLPHLVIVMAEAEYGTDKSLPEFARKHLGEDFRVSLIFSDAEDGNRLPGIEALDKADLALFSIRRRTPPEEQLAVVRRFIEAGKPLVALRTSSHAFSLRNQQPPQGHASWDEFDRDVIGGNYHGHHPNNPRGEQRTIVWPLPAAKDHPILAGIEPGEQVVPSGLYKTRPLADSATPLWMGRFGDAKPHEPVAWTNQTKWGGKVFYVALGTPAEIADDRIARLLVNSLHWAVDQQPAAPAQKESPPVDATPADEQSSQRQPGWRSPEQALRAFQVPDDLLWEQVLTEPEIKQPVSISFDERGRMWVVQYQQYPHPAGLTMVSRDNYWRAVYDKTPPPPPHHFVGKDKITIHEDVDGDGKYDRHKTFVEGLNICTAAAPGRGGVWVLNPPYLLFYADRDRDDQPDGDPEVHLEGFGLEDTHATVNSLRFGPDGWLYAAQGSTVTGRVTRPGGELPPVHSMGQLVWRYHPSQRRYEVFAEGGGNTYGIEFDAQGRLYSGHNGGNTRGFHYVQGGYYRKGFDKHGALSNPYTFGYFEAMRHAKVPRFTHTFLIYESQALPPAYRGKLYGVEPLQGQIVRSQITADRSSFQTEDLDRVVQCDDPWFRPVDIKEGPLGAIYVADWYDSQVSHLRNHEGQIDPHSGRIYRLRSPQAAVAAPRDLGKLTSLELVALLESDSKWTRQTVQRLLGDRRDPALIAPLRTKLADARGQLALESLWALHNSGGLDAETTIAALRHVEPQVRLWAARLACDERQVAPQVVTELVALARREERVEVRSQLASSARRLPAEDCLAVVVELLNHDADRDDVHQPLLIWWAIEAHADEGREAILAALSDADLWRRPMFEAHCAERLMRRFAATGVRGDLLVCAKLLELAPDRAAQDRLVRGFTAAYSGRSLVGLPDELIDALGQAGGGSLVLKVRRGDPDAVRQALKLAADETADPRQRQELIEVFGQVDAPEAVDVLLEVLAQQASGELHAAALSALSSYSEPRIAAAIIACHGSLDAATQEAAIGVLARRPAWSAAVLQAVAAGRLDKRAVADDQLRKMQLHNQAELNDRIAELYGEIAGATTAEMQQQIARLAQVVDAATGSPYRGKQLYRQSCAKCHRLFEEGGEVGPDLTVYQRHDLSGMLLAIINPSAEIREGYENYLVLTDDGRALTGFIADQDAQVIEIRGPDASTTLIERDAVDEIKPLARSVMPDGLLDELNDQQVRDLFAYLRGTQPLND